MFIFKKANPRSTTVILEKLKGGKKATLIKLKSFLDAQEPKTVEWLVSFWNAQGNAITYKELREAYLSGGLTDKQLEKWQKQYSNLVNTALAPQWYAAIKDAGKAVQAQYPYFLYEPFVGAMQEYIKNNGAALVTALVNEQGDALQALIANAAHYDGMTPDELSRLMRPVIGLTKPQALANLNYYNNVKKQLLKAHPRMTNASATAKAQEAAAKYAAKQHRYRAMTIARTELAAAYNEGHFGATKDAQAQGYIGECEKFFLTADDERVCKICGAIDGETQPMDEIFSFGKKLPPVHPSCRCAVGYREIMKPLTSKPKDDKIKPEDKIKSPPDKQKLRDAALAKPKHERTEDDWRAIWETDTRDWDKLDDNARSDLLKRLEGDWINRLTPDEESAVRTYTGSAYTAINNFARFGNVGGGYSKSHLTKLNELLKSAFAKADLDRDIRVARGVNGAYADKIRNMKVGEIDIDMAVRSTSYTRRAAFGGLTMDISVPAGAGRGSLVTALSHYGDGEKEFIIAPGAKLRLIEYDSSKDRAYFELIP